MAIKTIWVLEDAMGEKGRAFQKSSTLMYREARFGWALILPSVFLLASLILYPVIYNIVLSFFSFGANGDRRFSGFDNYRKILQDPAFRRALWTTIIYVVGTTVGTTGLGLVTALAMNRKFLGRALVRSLILLPYVAPVISVVYSWQFFFDPVNGLFMDVFYERLAVFAERVNLISSPETSVWIAMLFGIWKNFPFAYLLILSRLQAIDTSLYEAAEVDGASWWQSFKAITFPEILFILNTLVLLRVIWNFNKFEEVYLLSSNIPVLSVYTYLQAFTGSMNLGYGAALSVIQFLILAGFILLYIKRGLKW